MFKIIIAFVFVVLLLACEKPVIVTHETIIGIQPLGNVPKSEVDSVMSAVQKMYAFQVVKLDRMDLPMSAFTEVRTPRYRADSLVLWLSREKPDSIDFIVGLTAKDISKTKYNSSKTAIKEPKNKYKDFGIFGLGQVGGPSCILSSYRLHKDVDRAGFFKRLARISCHEIGHVLGLYHCLEPNCLMNETKETILTIDNSTGDLCEKCEAILYLE